MNRVETYSEFDCLVPDKALEDPVRGICYCASFNDLRDFVLSADAADVFFRYAKRRGLGECITLQNYVGTIRFADGKQLEILPKICKGSEAASGRARALVLEMLRCLRDAPFQVSGTAQLRTAQMSLLEVFIRMFLDEVQRLVRDGIRADYVSLRGNLNRGRGRILPAGQLRHNLLHPERLFCAYDEYLPDSAENRLVKATMHTLLRQAGVYALQRDIHRLLAYFDDVSDTVAYAAEFARVRQDRNRREYSRLMEWARVFLLGKSFTNYAGTNHAQALLFPMERLFEDYVAHHVRRHFSASGWQVTAQDCSAYLFENVENTEKRSFRLKPDLVLRCGEQTVVMDTKWKLLSRDQIKHFGVSQEDMYQMCTYAACFSASHVYLLYPRQEWMKCDTPVFRYSSSPTGATVTLFPLNWQVEKGMEASLQALNDDMAGSFPAC